MSASKSKTGTKATTESSPSFEQTFAELETIVAQMESGQMPLEASLAAYQRGNALLQDCQKSLTDVEQQVKILTSKNRLMPLQSPED